MSKAVTLVYDPICPFAQRAWLTLLEKQVPFNKMRVDIMNKSQEFTNVYSKAYARDPNNKGIVPVIVYGDQTIAESDLISWFVSEEFSTGTELIPKDSFERVKMRWFIKDTVPKLVGAFYSTKGMAKKPEDEQKKIRQNVNKAFKAIEQGIQGPYAIGKQFTLADVMLYPWLERYVAQKVTYGIDIPEECKKIRELKALVEERPSVKQTKKETGDEFIIANYKPYLLGDVTL